MAGTRNTSPYGVSIVQNLAGEVRDNSVALATFSAELKNAIENVSALSRILKDGNGHPSLITKVTILENSVRDLSSKVDKLSGELDRMESEKVKEEKSVRGERLRMIGTVVAALLALAGSVASLVLN